MTEEKWAGACIRRPARGIYPIRAKGAYAMTTLHLPTLTCPECANHGCVPDEFGGLSTCGTCGDRPAASDLTPVDLAGLCSRLEAAAEQADHQATHHGATHQRDTSRGVARGLRHAVDLIRQLYGLPVD